MLDAGVLCIDDSQITKMKMDDKLRNTRTLMQTDTE